MKAFIDRYYLFILGALIISLMALSFLLGRQMGQGVKEKEGVTLSCNENVLQALKIPVSALAAGSATPIVAGASTTTNSSVQRKFFGS